MSFTRQAALRDQALTRDQTRSVFGQVMGLVALTFGCMALGAYLGRNKTGGTGILFFLVAFACLFGLQYAAARGREQLAIGLLFGLGLCFGLALGPVLAAYAKADPSAVYQAAGATALFAGGLGAYGYATRRDLSSWYRALFLALIALIVFGLVTLFVAIPGANMIYSVLGLVSSAGSRSSTSTACAARRWPARCRSRRRSSWTSSTSSCSSSRCSAAAALAADAGPDRS